VYIVTSSLHGYIKIDGRNASTFTQADVDGDKLTFTHDGSVGAQAGFYFTVTDGTTTLPEQLFAIPVTSVDDPPVVIRNQGATVYKVMADLNSIRWSATNTPSLHPRAEWGCSDLLKRLAV
jgi:hypothetical protein